jgi:hypothetical protein
MEEREVRMIDIAAPTQEVELVISQVRGGSQGNCTVWVNVDGVCRLRISNVSVGILKIEDGRT